MLTIKFRYTIIIDFQVRVKFYEEKFMQKIINYLKKIIFKQKSSRNAQEWLDKIYPLHKRKRITELLLQNLRLEGPLSLKGFVDLIVINCRHNRITSLDLSDCKKLRRLYCDDNQKIKRLDLSNLSSLEWLDCCDNRFADLNFLNTIPNPKKLRALVICNNEFSPTDLNWFSRFTNLEILMIDKHTWIKNKNQQEILCQKNNHNRFFGSLKHLQSLNKLKILSLKDTNVNDDLEHLPSSITRFYFEGNKKIENKLREYDFNLWEWRKCNYNNA